MTTAIEPRARRQWHRLAALCATLIGAGPEVLKHVSMIGNDVSDPPPRASDSFVDRSSRRLWQ